MRGGYEKGAVGTMDRPRPSYIPVPKKVIIPDEHRAALSDWLAARTVESDIPDAPLIVALETQVDWRDLERAADAAGLIVSRGTGVPDYVCVVTKDEGRFMDTGRPRPPVVKQRTVLFSAEHASALDEWLATYHPGEQVWVNEDTASVTAQVGHDGTEWQALVDAFQVAGLTVMRNMTARIPSHEPEYCYAMSTAHLPPVPARREGEARREPEA